MLLLTLWAAIVFIFTGCPSPVNGPSSPQYSTIGEVQITGGTVAADQIELTWAEPPDADFAGVVIEYTQTLTIPKGTTSATLSNGITLGTEVEITIRSIDSYDLKTPGITISIHPQASVVDLNIIRTASDLAAIGTGGAGADEYYMQFADIDLGAGPWTPLMAGSSFTGVFDGGDFSIFDMDVSSSDVAGLFARANGALFTRINVANATVSASGSYAGVLVGLALNSTIVACSVTGNISGTAQDVGGLVGAILDGSIAGSEAVVDVEGTHSVGGLVGFIQSGTYAAPTFPVNPGVVSDSAAGGTISAGAGALGVGGLVGYNYRSIIRDSFSTAIVQGTVDSSYGGLLGFNEDGTVSNSYSLSSVSGAGRVGGLVGQNYSSDFTAEIIDSFAKGTIDVSGDVPANVYIGGIAASNNGNVSGSFSDVEMSATGGPSVSYIYAGGAFGSAGGSVSNTYATGTLEISGSDYDNVFTGGFAGNSFGSVNNSYTLTDVTLLETAQGLMLLGGFVGYTSSGTLEDNYSFGTVSGPGSATDYGGFAGYVTSASILTSYAYSGSGPAAPIASGTGDVVYLTAAEMTVESNYSGWDFTGTWRIDAPAHGDFPYPHLVTLPPPSWP